MAEWGLPPETIEQLRQSLGQKFRDQDIGIARGALRAIFEEADSWSDYIEEHRKSMWHSTWWIVGAIGGTTSVAIALIHFPKLTLGALFLAGVAGSCASVLSKVPYPELLRSSELEAYPWRILSRIGAGAVLSFIASAVIGWGIPVPVQGETFSTILRSCSASPRGVCTEFEMLFLLGVAMGFGFSERLATHFEGSWFEQFRRRPGRARGVPPAT